MTMTMSTISLSASFPFRLNQGCVTCSRKNEQWELQASVALQDGVLKSHIHNRIHNQIDSVVHHANRDYKNIKRIPGMAGAFKVKDPIVQNILHIIVESISVCEPYQLLAQLNSFHFDFIQLY
ncbi:hypothetical protein GQX74_003378 [Glossina fuscipes]|nr:hypothetical protein GQX74_003378 [Glossina fuscipes]